MAKRVLIRADGNPGIGLGHIIRSRSLAEFISPEFQVQFIVCPETANYLRQFPAVLPFSWRACPLDEVAFLSEAVGKDSLLVVDTYSHDDSLLSRLREKGIRVLLIDDQARLDAPCFAVLNHLVGAEQLLYRGAEHFLLGPSYALLRREFLACARRSVAFERPYRCFLSFGGSLLAKEFLFCAIELLLRECGESVRSVELLGSRADLHLVSAFGSKLRVYYELGPADIIELVKKCNLAIVAPGMTSYEIFSVGCPAICQAVSPSQSGIPEIFQECSLVKALPSLSCLSTTVNAITDRGASRMLAAQYEVFDGLSASRILAWVRSVM